MKRLIAATMAMALLLTLLPVSAATWNSTYSDAFLASNYSGDTQHFKTLDGWAYIWTNWGANASIFYDKQMWQDDFTYTVRINNEGSTPGKTTMMYFCYQSANNYYAIRFGNDEATDIRLYKRVQGVEQLLATAETFIKMQEHTVKITRTAEGNISAIATKAVSGNTVTTQLFSNVNDTDLNYGKVGFGYNGDGGRFNNISVSGTEYVPPTDPGQPDDETLSEVAERSTTGGFVQGGNIPEGWSGSGFIVSPDWNALRESVWGGSGTLIYEPFVWQDELTISAQIQNYSSSTTSMIYFMYQDTNNYYRLSFTGDETRLIKKEKGVEQVLGTWPFALNDHTVRLTYLGGNIGLTALPKKGTEADRVTVFSDVVDKSLLSGNIGLGYSGGGLHMGNLSVKGMARMRIEPKTEQPLVFHHRTGNRVAVLANWENEQKQAATPMIALYEQQKENLILVGIAQGARSSAETVSLMEEFAIKPDAQYVAKAFLWDDASTMRPLAQVLEKQYERNNYKVLAIGNSFSEDAATHLHAIAARAGVNLEIGNLYIGGCSLDTHWKNASQDLGAYRYDVNGATGMEQNVSIRQALLKDNWDFVTIQQASPDSGRWETYSKVGNLAQYIRQYAPQAEIVVHQTWAYEKGSNHGSFPNYQNDQLVMFNALKDAYSKAANAVSVALGGEIVNIIPCGEAMQYARNATIDGVKVFDTTFQGNTNNDNNVLNRDGYHCSQSYGRYLLGLVWYESLTGLPVSDNAFRPSATKPTDAQMQLLKDAAHRAVAEHGLIAQ